MIKKKIIEVEYDDNVPDSFEKLGREFLREAQDKDIYLPNKKILVVIEIID